MKKLMESFVNEAKNINQPKKEKTSKLSQQNKRSKIFLNCIKCQREKENNYDKSKNTDVEYSLYELEPLLVLPNNHNAFTSEESLQNETKVKTFNSNEGHSIKYNYLLNKFI